MHVIVTGEGNSTGTLTYGGISVQCALGRTGLTHDKKEGDGKTPMGSFALRRVYYRPDRIQELHTDLPHLNLSPEYGWCDDPDYPTYNHIVSLPYPTRAEPMWREDHLYDLLIVIGYNDDPVVPGKGSAIFLHLATEDYQPTEGCVAISREDMLDLLPRLEPGSIIEIRERKPFS